MGNDARQGMGSRWNRFGPTCHGRITTRGSGEAPPGPGQKQSAELKRLEERLSALADALERAEDVSADDFLTTIEQMTMIEKYYTPEQLKQLKARKAQLGEGRSRKWSGSGPISSRPSRPPSRPASTRPTRRGGLARTWFGLVNEFTGGDPGIARSLKNMYENEERVGGKDVASLHPLMDFIGKAAGAGQDQEALALNRSSPTSRDPQPDGPFRQDPGVSTHDSTSRIHRPPRLRHRIGRLRRTEVRRLGRADHEGVDRPPPIASRRGGQGSTPGRHDDHRGDTDLVPIEDRRVREQTASPPLPTLVDVFKPMQGMTAAEIHARAEAMRAAASVKKTKASP